MILVHFTHGVLSLNDVKRISQISEYFTVRNMMVKYSAASQQIKSQLQVHFDDELIVENLFSVETAEKHFVNYVINLGESPSEFLTLLTEPATLRTITSITRTKDLWTDHRPNTSPIEIDFSFFSTGATFKTLMAAEKLKVYADDTHPLIEIHDLKLKQLFLAHKLEMRQMDIKKL